MTREAEIDGLELLEMSEDAPDQVETIIEMMIEAGEELVYDEEPQDES
jgi:hypothetical protein